MMTLQARQLLAHPLDDGLRAYPPDSPRAKARLLVLALLADGELAGDELAALQRRGALSELGIDRDSFFQVLYDFCADAARLPRDAGGFQLAPATLDRLFAEVRTGEEQARLLRLMLEVVAADGRLAEGEAQLLRNALGAWDVGLGDAHGATGANGAMGAIGTVGAPGTMGADRRRPVR